MRSPRAALYARVSSQQQAHSRTIASQVASLRERITADGARLEPEHAFLDEGYSGATCCVPPWSGCATPWRPAPSTASMSIPGSPGPALRLPGAPDRGGPPCGRGDHLNRPIGGSAEDDLLLQVQGMIAEYERAKILERSRRGRRHAARSGSVSALCAAPFGYRYVGKVAGGGMARFEVIDDEARIVRQIFAWVGLERVSLHEVCRRLAETGCRTRTGLARWDPTTVCGMLRNPAYIGGPLSGAHVSCHLGSACARSGAALGHLGRPTPHPGSSRGVDRGPCARPGRAGAVRGSAGPAGREPATPAGGRRRPGWLLQGLVVCRRCGYAFYGEIARGKVGGDKKAEYGYYRCLGTDGHRLAAWRRVPSLGTRRLPRAGVWAEIRCSPGDPPPLLLNTNVVSTSCSRARGSRPGPTLDRSIEGLHRGIGRLINSYAEGVIDRDEFQPRIAGLKERLARMKEQDRRWPRRLRPNAAWPW